MLAMTGNSSQAEQDIAIAITGSGGSGAVTAGLTLLSAVARAGFYGLMTRSAGPQIRGGESAAMVRFASRPVQSMGDRFDLVVGLDWRNLTRFIEEIPLDGRSLILTDPAAGPIPPALVATGASVCEVPFKALASGVGGDRINMAALGAIGAFVGLPLDALIAGALETLKGKAAEIAEGAVVCIRAGYAVHPSDRNLSVLHSGTRWNISGNEASGLGALRGGVRFVAAYPITPASEMLEWLAPRLERLGGSLLQAEDELASINMIIGSSFGGVPSLTATSGPGLSLMMEGVGLAVASETPLVVANVMRGGPSTGIPTKSEQSDLQIALYGLHGDAPHIVIAALDIRDCVFACQWAVLLAEHLQTPVILLTDQSIGQSRAIVDPPQTVEDDLRRAVTAPSGKPYRRYALTDDGVSPMAIPGTAGCMYTADGLEHNQRGSPSSGAGDHLEQLEKRRRKVEEFDYGDSWAEIQGSGPLCLVTWGSSTGAAREAGKRLTAAGRPSRVVALRLIAPLRRDALRDALQSAKQVFVIEQNHGGQLFHYLHAEQGLPPHARSFSRPGPLPLRPGEIVEALSQET